jgi:glycosyltransferase involved in cell wall biosynthesis
VKPKILHIIDSFSKGGAEVLLAGIIPEMPQYNHTILYLTPTKYPIMTAVPENVTIECLGFTKLTDAKKVLACINAHIKKDKPSIIHTHLYYSSILIRFAQTNSIQIVQTYHNQYYRIRYSKWTARIFKIGMKLLDRYTMKPSIAVLHVSKTQQKLNDRDVQIKSSSVLYNFIEDVFFKSRTKIFSNTNNKLNIVSVGNLKTEKNHILLLRAIKILPHLPMHVNIFGQGNDNRMLQEYINKHQLPATIHGSREGIDEILEAHDLFISCSIMEGFGISVAEAMASEIPMIISDLPTFIEVTENKACFFKSNDVADLARKIDDFYTSPETFRHYVIDCKKVAEKYRKSYYLSELNKLYFKYI